MTVVVEDNGDGTLKVTPSEEFSALDFINTVNNSGEIQFAGTKWLKKFTGPDKPTFTILLYEVVDGTEQLIDTAKVTGSGRYSFNKITYYEPGTHEYIVREEQGSYPGITYDETEYNITVNVIINEKGNLEVKVSGARPLWLNFTNEAEGGEKPPHLPETGFSAIRPQALPKQPQDLKYKQLNWRIEIPKLELSTEIVQVPEIDGQYPVTWLGSAAGLLEGSSLPGQGHALVTGHNHLNTMEAGPFALLNTLSEGDRIFVTDPHNALQIYEIYINTKIDEYDFAGLQKISDTDARSLTLITCEDESTEGGYENRRIIAARPIL